MNWLLDVLISKLSSMVLTYCMLTLGNVSSVLRSTFITVGHTSQYYAGCLVMQRMFSISTVRDASQYYAGYSVLVNWYYPCYGVGDTLSTVEDIQFFEGKVSVIWGILSVAPGHILIAKHVNKALRLTLFLIGIVATSVHRKWNWTD